MGQHTHSTQAHLCKSPSFYFDYIWIDSSSVIFICLMYKFGRKAEEVGRRESRNLFSSLLFLPSFLNTSLLTLTTPLSYLSNTPSCSYLTHLPPFLFSSRLLVRHPWCRRWVWTASCSLTATISKKNQVSFCLEEMRECGWSVGVCYSVRVMEGVEGVFVVECDEGMGERGSMA